MSEFETFVNTELPRRSALLTFANTGFNGDPNVGAPAIITGAPLGTYYHRQGTDEFYRKNGAGVWVVGGGGGGSSLLDPKDSCRVATTGNITLSGLQTIDSVAVLAGERVLVKDQTDKTQNGPYLASAGAWTRTTDADTNADVTPGMFVFIEEGVTWKETGWILATDGPIVLGTSLLTFVRFDFTAADRLSTQEVLTFPVDYNDGLAVDAPANTVFPNQAEINAFLASQGATNFKHVAAVYESLPFVVRHNVAINLAAGVHRPRAAETSSRAFPTVGKIIQSAALVTISGPLPSSYTTLVADQTITAVQVGSQDPYVDVSGTPFAGLNLKGYFALFSTGQITVIHEHTSSRLKVLATISPAAPTTVRVVKPSTVLRNSLADATFFKATTVAPEPDVSGNLGISYQHVEIQNFGATFTCAGIGAHRYVNVLLDFAEQKNLFGAAAANGNGRGWQPSSGSTTFISGCSVRGARLATVSANTTDEPLFLPGASGGRGPAAAQFFNSYAGGCNGAFAVAGGNLSLSHAIIDDCSGFAGVSVSDGISTQGLVFCQDGFSVPASRQTTIRNCAVGLYLGHCGSLQADGQIIAFEGITGSCVYMTRGAVMDLVGGGGALGFINGPAGGNLGVGIEIDPATAGNRLSLPAGTNVSGALGDFQFGGVVDTYANLVALGPYVDSAGNYLEKA